MINGDYLTEESNFEKKRELCKTQGCLYITTTVYDKEYVMLIDSGAEISAISSQLEDQIIKNHGAITTLPLSGLSVHNAIGEKNMKVNTKAYRQI